MRFYGLACGMVLVMASAVMGAEPIFEFRFNDAGGTTISTGKSQAVLTFYDAQRQPSDLHGIAGSGVAGDLEGHDQQGKDIAFDNSIAERMQGPGGIALNEDDTSVSGLSSWTISGWYKTDQDEVPLSGGGTVLFMTPPRFTGEPGLANAGFAVRGENPNGLRTSVNGGNTATGSSGIDEWLDAQTWVFFAVTYDGTADTDNLRYYRGYRNQKESSIGSERVSLVAVDNLAKGPTLPAAGFSIGNRTDDYGRAFDGFLDNVRVFGDRINATGALSLADLELIRAGDMARRGDFDFDQKLSAADIELLRQAIRKGASERTRYDVNRDQFIDSADITFWVHDLKKTYFGDANLDGEFNSQDLVLVFQAGQYEDALPGNSTWSTGDWNGDQEFSTDDFVMAFADGGYEQGARRSVSAVPEPSALMMALVCWGALIGIRRRSAPSPSLA